MPSPDIHEEPGVPRARDQLAVDAAGEAPPIDMSRRVRLGCHVAPRGEAGERPAREWESYSEGPCGTGMGAGQAVTELVSLYWATWGWRIVRDGWEVQTQGGRCSKYSQTVVATM